MTTLSMDNRESLAHAALCLVCDQHVGAISGPAFATVGFAQVGRTAIPVEVNVYAPFGVRVAQRLADCTPAFSLAFQHRDASWVLEKSPVRA